MMVSQTGEAAAQIPVVDLNSDDAAQKMLRAAIDFGFIFVKHQDLELTPDNVEVQRSICRTAKGKGGVLYPLRQVRKKPWLGRAFNIGEFVGGKAQQSFPLPLRFHEVELGLFFGKCHALCNQILELLAEGLEIPLEDGGKEWFRSRHDQDQSPSGSVLRLLYVSLKQKLPVSLCSDNARSIPNCRH
ncbi:hypothetical protein FH972_024430 [Carpinus fangiana]|uniref:Non-haem dioxygenase N-terminal domain-containing protein n=1 Tax=Carpinus fangiana TaxID=176857 RepID=A0A5N6KYR1_9ROSI|nr:hypothetical protein FH972_024430 [Carpinus fangiana]